MATVLLIIIYIAFIGLGIPDSLFGTACHILRLRSAFFIRKLCYGHSVMRNCYIKHYQL